MLSRSSAQCKNTVTLHESNWECSPRYHRTIKTTATSAYIFEIVSIIGTTFVSLRIFLDRASSTFLRRTHLSHFRVARSRALPGSCWPASLVSPLLLKLSTLDILIAIHSLTWSQPNTYRSQARKYLASTQCISDLHLQPQYSYFLHNNAAQRTTTKSIIRYRNSVNRLWVSDLRWRVPFVCCFNKTLPGSRNHTKSWLELSLWYMEYWVHLGRVFYWRCTLPNAWQSGTLGHDGKCLQWTYWCETCTSGYEHWERWIELCSQVRVFRFSNVHTTDNISGISQGSTDWTTLTRKPKRPLNVM